MKSRAPDACRQKGLSLQLRTWRGRLDGSVAEGQRESLGAARSDHMTHVCIILKIQLFPMCMGGMRLNGAQWW